MLCKWSLFKRLLLSSLGAEIVVLGCSYTPLEKLIAALKDRELLLLAAAKTIHVNDQAIRDLLFNISTMRIGTSPSISFRAR